MKHATRRNVTSGNTFTEDSETTNDAKRIYSLTPLAAAVVAALSPTEAVVAQEEDDSAIEVIIVTATKRQESIQDVPQAISAFSTLEIERRGILDMADVATNLPSISLSTTRAGRNELVYRGISAGSTWRLDSLVAVYLDEMPMTMSTTQLDPRMVDIERVESLPGPQGTLFGSSSQSGTLRVITNKPRFGEFSGEVMAELKETTGGEESYDINGHLNIPVSDNFAIRLVAYHNKDGGYIDNVFATAPHSVCDGAAAIGGDNGYTCDHDFDQYDYGPFDPNDQQGHLDSFVPDNAGLEQDDFNDYEMTGGRISALWNMNEDWSLLGVYMMQESETTGVWYSDTGIGDYKVARFSDEWRKDDWWNAALTVEGDLGFARITNSFGYAERDQSYVFDNTHYDAYHTRLKGQYWSAWRNWYDAYWYYTYNTYNYYDKYDTDYNGGVYKSLQEAERITNEIRLTSTTDSRFQWMVGAFYENHKDGWVDQGIIPNLDTTKHWRYTQFRSCELAGQGVENIQCPAPEVNDVWYQDSYRRDATHIAAFGEVDYDFTDALTGTFGLRWFQYDRYTVNDQQWPLHMPVEAIAIDGESAFIEDGTENDTFFKFGVNWAMSDDAMVYGLFSQGFRLGGHNNPKAVRVNFVEATYDPDKLNNYEIGIKSEWLDNTLQLNASVFYLDWEDIQLVIGSDQSGLWWLTGQGNGGGGENLGVEVDFDWRATENLRISGSAYVGDPVYTHDYITLEGVQEVTKGTSMPDSAKEKFFIAADYTIPDVLGGDIWLRWDTFYVGPLYSALWRAEESNPNSPEYAGSTYDVDSFTKHNFQAGYERENWAVTLFVKNVTDERANTFTFNGTSWYALQYWGHQGFGEQHTLARPRTTSLRFTYRF
jgi:outer membrane receptor protein involved in Fe transport